MTDERDDDLRDSGRKGPDAFRTISEVADELGLPQHVLRFWETKFPQVKPVKRGGGRRYYRPNDVELLRGVKKLLYGEGYTIRGVQRILREQGGRKLAQAAGGEAARPESTQASDTAMQQSGPEIWAPGRRPEPVFSPADDPQLPLDAYDARDERVAVEDDLAPEPLETVEPPPPGERLTGDQTRRLTSALDELLACRRLLEGRS